MTGFVGGGVSEGSEEAGRQKRKDALSKTLGTPVDRRAGLLSVCLSVDRQADRRIDK